ncbi:MAG: hypothetical protein ABIW94_08850, partial [Gemmatimonadaceae bacterium]
ILGRPTVSTQPRSVGGVVLPAQNCMVALDPTKKDAFDVVAGAVVDAQNCNIAVNSNNVQALHVVCSNPTSLEADAISVTGNMYGCGIPNLATTPTTGVTPASDPLAGVTLAVSDTSGACIGGSYGLTVISGTGTLNPGVYCGGIKVTGIATFNPGLYVIKGGGFEVSSGGRVTGAGVGFIDLNAPPANGGAGKFAVFDLASDAVVNFSAMTTGPISGILFYAPAGTGDPNKLNEHHIKSAGNVTMSGSIYLPTHALQVGGGTGTTLNINGGIVAGTIQFSSGSTVTVLGFSGGGGYYTLKRASIVE